MKKKSINFVAFLERTIFVNLVCVAFFIATNTALNAAEHRLSNSNGCYTARLVIVLSKAEKDSLSLFNYFNFSFMERTMKDESKANNSTLTSNVAHQASQHFSFEGTSDVQVVIINGNPYFVAVDVCNALNLQNTSDRVTDCLDDDEYLLYQIDRAGQKRTLNIVSESGLYALIIRSNKPIARKFRKWITSEVLPSIRKTGTYITPQAAEALTGQYIHVTGAEGNLYMFSILKAIIEFIQEEIKATICSELRLDNKLKAARTLFFDSRLDLRNSNVKISSATGKPFK